MAISVYTRSHGVQSVGAITVDDNPAFIADFIGDRDSEGFTLIAPSVCGTTTWTPAGCSPMTAWSGSSKA